MIIERLFHLPRWLRDQRQRHRSRRELLNLDDHLLADIGIDRDMVEREVRKPFWR